MSYLHFTDEQQDDLAELSPAITTEQMESMEAASLDSVRGQQRRLALLASARSSGELRKFCVEAPAAFIEMLEMVQAFGEHTKGLSEIAESALARMLFAGGAGDTNSEEVAA
mgnify:CR=1 FL=1